jgi:hypothetical protein
MFVFSPSLPSFLISLIYSFIHTLIAIGDQAPCQMLGVKRQEGPTCQPGFLVANPRGWL